MSASRFAIFENIEQYVHEWYLQFCGNENNHFFYAICSSVADNKNFHTAGAENDQPYLYCTLTQPGDKVRNISHVIF